MVQYIGYSNGMTGIMPGTLTLDDIFKSNGNGSNVAATIQSMIRNGTQGQLAPDALQWYQNIPNIDAYISGQTGPVSAAPTSSAQAPATPAQSAPSAGNTANIYNPSTGETQYLPDLSSVNNLPQGFQPIPAGGIPQAPSPTGTSAPVPTDTSVGGPQQASGASGGVTITSTGDPKTDAILASLKATADGLLNAGTLPANLQVTPTLISDFLAYAHSQADPYTQQLISDALPNINSSLNNLATKYGNDMGALIQDFGTNLNTEQNSAGANGTAFSSSRITNENNLVNSTNRSLSSLGSDAALNIGNVARQGASQVGTANTGGINLPDIVGGSVSLAGGSRGSSFTTNPLNYNYNPSLYTVGTINDAQNTAVNQRAQGFNTLYGTLAGANTGRSMTDLFGMATGATGSQLPTNLT